MKKINLKPRKEENTINLEHKYKLKQIDEKKKLNKKSKK